MNIIIQIQYTTFILETQRLFRIQPKILPGSIFDSFIFNNYSIKSDSMEKFSRAGIETQNAPRNPRRSGDLPFWHFLPQQYFNPRSLFFCQLLEFSPPCGILCLSYSSPLWFLLCDDFTITTSAMAFQVKIYSVCEDAGRVP